MTVEGKLKLQNSWRKSDYHYLQENIDILPFLSVESDGNPLSQILEAV